MNADDFGFTPDVNDGIIEAHRNGILTATTLMANGAAFDHAIRLARQNPSLDMGCHLVLVGGESLLDGRAFPMTVAELLRGMIAGKWDVYRELKAQVEKILAAGILPTHLDTHKHTHLLPPVLQAVARLSAEFEIPWVRRPFDFPLNGSPAPAGRRILARSLGFLRPKFHAVLSRFGCRTTDYFAGFGLTGAFEAGDLVRLIGSLPDGSTEFMCHPGFLRAELRAARTRLKQNREEELKALTDPLLRPALTAAQVQLTNFRSLSSR